MSSLSSKGPDSTPGGSARTPRALTRRELFSLGRTEEEGHWIRIHRAAMACRFEVLLDGADEAHVPAAREALDEADRLEAALSVFRETSELSRVDRTAAEMAAPVDAGLVAGGRLARLRLRDGALATSGAGEQFFEVDGRRYGHVIDPRSGWPASGVLNVSVVTAEGALSDALSTAFLVGGLDVARRYCASYPQTLALLTPEGGRMRPIVLGTFAGARMEEA